MFANGVIQSQQDHSSICDSRVIQGWLSRQTDAELIHWPPQARGMNHTEKPRMASLRNTQILSGPLCLTLEMKLLRIHMFDLSVHARRMRSAV
jgi:hypothetical protein